MTMSILFGAFMVGAFCGFLPLLVGIVRRRADLGWAGFAFTLFGGLLLGIFLAFLFSLIATTAILMAEKGQK